jgi:hypothetical protein
MLAWIGTALLAASWLFGLPYYHQPNWLAWAVLIVLGTAAMADSAVRRAPWWHWLAVGILLLPAIALAAWPLRTAFLAGLAGCVAAGVAEALPPRWAGRRWLPQRLAQAGISAAAVLATQGLTLFIYQAITARSHELPAPLPGVIGAVAEYLGVTTGVCKSTVAIFSMREQHMLGATWELLTDPVSVAFLAGGLALLAARTWAADGNRQAWRRCLRSAAALALIMAVWLPLRSGLVIGLFLTSVLRTEYEAMPNSVHWLWNGWLHLALLALPVLVLCRFLPWCLSEAAPAPSSPAPAEPSPPSCWRAPAAVAVALLAALLLTLAVAWDPPGTRQQGRVLIEEYHPNPEEVWERCDKPFDTTWYGHMSGYNLYCIKDYLDHFYTVDRLTEPITAAALQKCDVFMLKTPTRPFYSPEEMLCIEDFVERGGSLLVIGEHTDVFKTSTRLNRVTRRFGFRFRNDCLFGVDSVFEQRFVPPRPAHPVVQAIETMDFATSCSLEVGRSLGRAVIRSTGLKNKTAEYHVNNYYPPPSDTAAMRYGAFIQLWSKRHGRGRVLAFTDSTIFSNFATFEPGKAELMMGMVEWLNHRPSRFPPWPWLILTALACAYASARLARGVRGLGLVLAAALAAGWGSGAAMAATLQRNAMPLPEPRAGREPVLAVMDRTVSSGVYPRNGFIAGKTDGFGIFERWILRLGYFTARRRAPDTFAPDVNLLVIAYPARSVSADYRQGLDSYLQTGGKVLVIDSARNAESTANELLAHFGITLAPTAAPKGELGNNAGWEPVPIERACRVEGGTPFAWLGQPEDGLCIGAVKRHGQGTLAVVGFGDRFCDLQMGYTGDVEPNEALRKVHAVQFALIRALVEGTDLTSPPPPPPPPAATE